MNLHNASSDSRTVFAPLRTDARAGRTCATRTSASRTSNPPRRGVAMVDVLIGGMLLGIGLAVVISLSTRSLRMQTDGEKQLVASWLVDELLSMVLVEGPQNYSKMYDVSGRFDAPFEEFNYEVHLEDQGVGLPYRVTATVFWQGSIGSKQVQVQTLIADRGVEAYQERAPYEYVDRLNRWYEIYEQQR